MKPLLLIIFLSLIVYAKETLVFGAISTVEAHLMEKKLTPLIKYLEEKTQKKIIFKTGYNYEDTIHKFSNRSFDIGFIGPSPYIKSKRINPDALSILAELQNADNSAFKSHLITKKGSSIHSLKDLKDKSFAFGSPNSTLSYFIPMNILIEKETLNSLKNYTFLGRHDRVAQYVIMGKYDAGAVKKSVADRYAKYLQNIETSEVYPEFLMVANSKLNEQLFKTIKKGTLRAQR